MTHTDNQSSAKKRHRSPEDSEIRKAFQAIIETTVDAFIIIDQDGIIEQVNTAAEKMFGYAEDKLLNQNVKCLIPAPHKHHHEEYISNYVKTGHRKAIGKIKELQGQRKDGSYFPIELSLNEMDSSEGKKFMAVIRDISTRKEEQQRQEEAKNRLREFMDSATEGFMLIDEKLSIIDVNKALLDMLHISDDRIIGKKITEISPGLKNEPRYKKYIDVLETGKTFSLDDLQINTLFGNLNISLRVFKVGNGLGMIVSDVTESKRFEAELIRAKEAAEASAKAKQEFLSNTSHEIRTPMNSIMGMAEMLSQTTLNSKQKKYIDAITCSSENLLIIINDILDLSKIGYGKLKLEETDFTLNEVIQKVNANHVHKAAEKKITLDCECKQADLNRVLLGDPGRLNQILTNLVNNAIKYTHKGKVTLSIELHGESHEYLGYVFKVSDTGIGIPKEKLNDVFSDFTQADTSTTRKYGGTGLGLTISKRLVEMMGGRLNAKSKVNIGSEFQFLLKFKKSAAEHYPKSTQIKIDNDCDLNGIRILLVEDHEFNQLVVQSMTENWNCYIEQASNGKEAIEKLSNESFDIILMDIQMPVMDGMETTKFIRNHMQETVKNIPIIALTAHSAKDDSERYLAYGMNAHISKPFKNHKLFDTICKHVKQNNHKTKASPVNKPYSLKAIEQMAEGNVEFVKKMINSFVKRSHEGMAEMLKDFDNHDLENIAKTAHRIKSSFKYLQIDHLYNQLVEIEKLAKKGKNVSRIKHLLAGFEKQLHYVNQELEKEL